MLRLCREYLFCFLSLAYRRGILCLEFVAMKEPGHGRIVEICRAENSLDGAYDRCGIYRLPPLITTERRGYVA